MKRFLIVDDQAGWRNHNSNAVYHIIGDEAYIEKASSAQEGYSKLLESKNNPYDYLLTDMQMESDYAPLMAGEWLIEQVQNLSFSYKTKIIIISASPMIRYIAERYGVDYISKANASISIEPYRELIVKI